MLKPTEILGYLCDAASFGDALLPRPTANSPQWVVSFEDFVSGGLSSHTTREILLSYSFAHDDVDFGSQAIPLLCCLRSALSYKDEQRVPLLCMRAMLDANGTLFPYPNSTAWIPQEMLGESIYRNEALCVCDYDTYRAHEAAMLSLPSEDTWSGAVERAIDLFDSVNELTPEALRESSATLDDSSCVLCIWERPDELREVSRVLGAIKHSVDAEDQSPDAALKSLAVSHLLNDAQAESVERAPQDEPDSSLPDEENIAPKLICGIPDFLPALGQREHEALVSIARQQAGSMQVVCAPKGTKSLPVAIGSMANLLTNHALRGELAPLMACVGNRSELLRLVELLADRPVTGQVALNSRWLPRISTSSPRGTERVERRTLGPLQALCIAHLADGIESFASSHCMQQPYGHLQGGDTLEYGDAWYIPKASIYFLDCISSFLGERVQSVAIAGALLSDLLRRVDQDRCELIDAYAGVCGAFELMKQRDNLVARIGRLRRGHTVCRDRLRFWESLIRDNQPRRTLLGKSSHNQREVIVRHMQVGEELAMGKMFLEDVCDAYRNEIARIETSIDRLRGAAANLTRKIKAAAPYSITCAEIIGRLSNACGLNPDQIALLEASIDGRTSEVSISHLDEVLDLTIRPAEFWLAVHVYESRWLAVCQRRLNSPSLRKEDSRPLWKDWPALCPFQLLPSDIAVGAISQLGGTDMESACFTVVLNGDEVDIPRGMAIAALSDQMILFGSEASLGARTLRHQAFDEVRTRAVMGEGAWEELKERGLCVSSESSLYSYAHGLERTAAIVLCDTYDSYGELDDLRTDLFPKEQLRTSRIPANSTDDGEYPLYSIVPAISYVLVPDSAWEQKGSSRQNHAEVQALSRWLHNHANDILARYAREERPPVVLVSPFKAQSALLRSYVNGLAPAIRQRLEVRTVSEIAEDMWPVVIACATCGPEGYEGLGRAGAKNFLALSTAAAKHALVVFCGGAWMRSHSKVARVALKHATRVGRLFSSPRTKKVVVHDENATSKDEVVLRSKPLSITALLANLKSRNEIGEVPSASAVNKALMKAGLIERVKDNKGNSGWRPTPAGREIGIVATKDHYGHPFCAYTRDSEAVVTSVVETME